MLNRTVERDLVLSIGDALQALDEADAAHTAKAPVGSMPPDELFFAGAEAGLAEPSAAELADDAVFIAELAEHAELPMGGARGHFVQKQGAIVEPVLDLGDEGRV